MSDEKTKVININEVFQDKRDENNEISFFLTIISGDNIGKIYPIEKEKTVIGRTEECDITIVEPSVSRQHAIITKKENDDLPLLVDLDSTNGTFLNGLRIQKTYLKDMDKIQFGRSVVFRVSKEDSLGKKLQEQLYETAIKDALTGAFNKRYFNERLKRDFSLALRTFRTMGLILIDIDFYKKINDTYGHPAGDAVLKELGRRISQSLRKSDVFCRYGGEEFAIIVRDSNNGMIYNIAERIRKLFDKRPIQVEDKLINVTISLGCSVLEDEEVMTPKDLLIVADKKLYEAKNSGRNCVKL